MKNLIDQFQEIITNKYESRIDRRNHLIVETEQGTITLSNGIVCISRSFDDREEFWFSSGNDEVFKTLIERFK